MLNEETKEITEVIEGTFRQYPIRLAWAITIHKSQGLTFERAIIDARNSFAHGQTYVALSRCKTLEGMVLESPLRREAIISDATVDNFTKAVEQNKPGSQQLNDMQKAYFFDLLSDLFNFYSIDQAYNSPTLPEQLKFGSIPFTTHHNTRFITATTSPIIPL